MKIIIQVNDITLDAELFDTNSADKIYQALPLQGSAHIWGGEIYFPIDVEMEVEQDAREEVEIGTIAFWPPGKMLCFFFGKTPVSTSDLPRAYSPVNSIGKITGDVKQLYSVPQGTLIQITQQ